MHRLNVPGCGPRVTGATVKRRSRGGLTLLLVCAVAIAAGAAGCSHTGAAPSASPLPTLTPGQQSAATGSEQMQAGVGSNRDVYFRSHSGSQGVTIRVLKGVWRRSLVAKDGTSHEQVLAVALQVTNSGRAGWGWKLRKLGELELADGVIGRSGHFSVAGQLAAATLQPGEVRGWLVFENVD